MDLKVVKYNNTKKIIIKMKEVMVCFCSIPEILLGGLKMEPKTQYLKLVFLKK